MIIINAAAILWLCYVATFNTAIKFVKGGAEGDGESIVPYQHLIFPIMALLLSSYFFIRYIMNGSSNERRQLS